MENNMLNQDVQPMRKIEKNKRGVFLYVGLAVVMVALGIFTGWKLPKSSKGKSTEETPKGLISKEEVAKGKEFGVKDPGKSDSAVGVVEKGGIDGEGTHKLLREGGPSQNIYMTSSVLDLDSFIGEKIQIWGETMKAQKAGWLMDIVKVKVLD